MKKAMKRVMAVLMTLAIAITALPTMEIKAADGEYTIKSATLPVDSVTLDNENPVVSIEGARFEISGIDENASYIQAIYICEEVNEYVEVLMHESEEAGVYTGELICEPDAKSGIYKLSYAWIYIDDTPTKRIYTNIPESSVTVVNNIVDDIPPVIEGVAFEQSGQTLKHGTDAVIEITAENIADTVGGAGVDYNSDDAYALITPVAGVGSRMVHFFPQADGTFKGSINVDELSNTEWYISKIYVADWMGNSTYYYPIENGQYWHFYVEDETGVCNKERNITVNFIDENDNVIKTETVIATKGEVVLADLLTEIPTYEMELVFRGWECEETGQMLKADTVFISTSSEDEFNFYPVGERRYVEVGLWILNEDGEFEWTGYEEYLIDYDATYQELIALLPTPPTVNGCAFVEWELYGWELTDIVEDDAIDLSAVYDKKIIEVSCYYLDAEGKNKYDNMTFPYEVDAKVTYKDILDAIPEYETYEGVTFVEWKLWDEEIDLTAEVEDTWLELNAVYDKYPVTIERTYVDTTGAVKKEKVTKLYPAGTSMESIYNEYAVTPSDASTTLSIEDWKVEADVSNEISSYNNELVLIAQYGNERIVEVVYNYIAPMDDHGVVKFETINIVVSNEIASDKDALVNYCKESVESKINASHYDACGFKGWDYTDFGNNDGDEYIDSVSAVSLINEDDIITVMAALSINSNDPVFYVYVVEAGATIELPWEHDGHYLEWSQQGDDGWIDLDGYSYVVPKDAIKGDSFMLISENGKGLPGVVDYSAEIIDDNKVLPVDVTLRAILLEEGDVVTATKTLIESQIKDIKNLAIYDITLVNSKGVLIEKLDNKIKVTIDLPFAVAAGNTINVFRVDGDKLVQCPTSISGNKLSFETDHFSIYVFVEQKAVPNTGDATNMIPYLTLLLLGAGVFMVGNKKRNLM